MYHGVWGVVLFAHHPWHAGVGRDGHLGSPVRIRLGTSTADRLHRPELVLHLHAQLAREPLKILSPLFTCIANGNATYQEFSHRDDFLT